MKIIEIKSLKIPEVKVIKYARFNDERGYFTEIFRKKQILDNPDLPDLKGSDFLQANESHSKRGVLRGLHFQWNPYMGKLVRTNNGHMVDLVMDVRLNSPTFGKIIAYDMPSNFSNDFNEWIFVPVGFAHGNFFLEETTIEYYCTGDYNPDCEVGISPLSQDIDWSLVDESIIKNFETLKKEGLIISPKDAKNMNLTQWKNDVRSSNFVYSK